MDYLKRDLPWAIAERIKVHPCIRIIIERIRTRETKEICWKAAIYFDKREKLGVKELLFFAAKRESIRY